MEKALAEQLNEIIERKIDLVTDRKLKAQNIVHSWVATVVSVDGLLITVQLPNDTNTLVKKNRSGATLEPGDEVYLHSKDDKLANAYVAVAKNKAPLGGGTAISYDSLTNRPKINTTHTTALIPNSAETLTGIVNLHKISKTGTYSDLVNIPDATTSSKGDMQVGAGLNVSSGVVNSNTNRVTTKTASATLNVNEEGMIVCNHASTPIVITLPSASGNIGVWYKIINIGAAGVVANGISLYTGDSTMFFSDGTNWNNYDGIKYRTLYCQTGNQTIGNTTTETTMIDGGVGSLIIPANATRVGDTLRIKLYGYISTNNPAPSSTIRIKYGGTTILTSTSTLPAGLVNQFAETEIIGTARTVGSSGTIFLQGRTLIHNGTGVTTVNMRQLLSTAATTINTTTTNAFEITYQWGEANAADTLTITNSTMELLRV